MLEQLKQETNYTTTENGALTYASSLNDCLDLFSSIGALRHADSDDIVARFQRAYAENAELAMKCLFFARDVRGGLGERRTFRIILDWLAKNHPESLKKNLVLIAEYGRFDDLVGLVESNLRKETLQVIAEQLNKDKAAIAAGQEGEISLLGKWLPSINASKPQTIHLAKVVAESLGMSNKEYRKTLASLRAAIKIIENNLRNKDYSFDYAKQPSKAMLKYRKAFMRNDDARYAEFLEKVDSGEVKLHTGTLTPYDIVAPIVSYNPKPMTEKECKALDTTWNSLEDFTNDENALVLVDGSGSMYSYNNPSPAAVAQSLGIYFAERNKGRFHNHFITFSEHPKLVEIKGKDIVEKLQYTMGFDECANTNIEAVFNLILQTAVKHRLPQSDLPSKLYIISDMEFDCCARNAGVTNFKNAKRSFKRAGYELPQVVFWNVDSRNCQVPVTKNEQGVALVSGCSPQVFSMLKKGILSPLSFMLEVLESERYAKVAA